LWQEGLLVWAMLGLGGLAVLAVTGRGDGESTHERSVWAHGGDTLGDFSGNFTAITPFSEKMPPRKKLEATGTESKTSFGTLLAKRGGAALVQGHWENRPAPVPQRNVGERHDSANIAALQDAAARARKASASGKAALPIGGEYVEDDDSLHVLARAREEVAALRRSTGLEAEAGVTEAKADDETALRLAKEDDAPPRHSAEGDGAASLCPATTEDDAAVRDASEVGDAGSLFTAILECEPPEDDAEVRDGDGNAGSLFTAILGREPPEPESMRIAPHPGQALAPRQAGQTLQWDAEAARGAIDDEKDDQESLETATGEVNDDSRFTAVLQTAPVPVKPKA
jgi:hypothetical protein